MEGRRLLFWFGYSAILPVIFMICAWAIEAFPHDAKKAFEDVFGSGDLIPLAALLFVGVAADIRLEDREKKLGIFYIANEMWFSLMGFILLIIYGFLKSKGIEFIRTPSPESADSLIEFSFLSCILMTYAIFHCGIAKSMLILRKDEV